MFESKIVKNIPVSDLVVIEGMYHEHFVNDEKNNEVFDESIGSAIDKTLGAAGEVADTAIKLPAKAVGYAKGLKRGMKKAAKKAGELGAAIMKVKKKQGKKAGGMAKKKMMGGGMTMKYKHGGKTGKCPRDGIAMRGKTRA